MILLGLASPLGCSVSFDHGVGGLSLMLELIISGVLTSHTAGKVTLSLRWYVKQMSDHNSQLMSYGHNPFHCIKTIRTWGVAVVSLLEDKMDNDMLKGWLLMADGGKDGLLKVRKHNKGGLNCVGISRTFSSSTSD